MQPVKQTEWCIGEHPVHESSQLEQKWNKQEGLEENQIDVVVALSDKIAKDSLGKSAADLARRKAKVKALDQVVDLRGQVLWEWQVCHAGQNEEQPEVYDNDKNDLEEELAVDILAQVESPVDDHQDKLDKKEVQEFFRYFIFF